jgi:hypothetical protein
MAEWAIFTQKIQGLWYKGFAFISFLRGCALHKKVPGAPARYQASFPITLKLFTKTFLIGTTVLIYILIYIYMCE